MQLPGVPGLAGSRPGLASFAAFVRHRLAELDTLAAALVSRREGPPDAPARADATPWAGPDVVIIAATAPFAATSYARARLLRQLHATGLLTAPETRQVERVSGVAQ